MSQSEFCKMENNVDFAGDIPHPPGCSHSNTPGMTLPAAELWGYQQRDLPGVPERKDLRGHHQQRESSRWSQSTQVFPTCWEMEVAMVRNASWGWTVFKIKKCSWKKRSCFCCKGPGRPCLSVALGMNVTSYQLQEPMAVSFKNIISSNGLRDMLQEPSMSTETISRFQTTFPQIRATGSNPLFTRQHGLWSRPTAPWVLGDGPVRLCDVWQGTMCHAMSLRLDHVFWTWLYQVVPRGVCIKGGETERLKNLFPKKTNNHFLLRFCRSTVFSHRPCTFHRFQIETGWFSMAPVSRSTRKKWKRKRIWRCTTREGTMWDPTKTVRVFLRCGSNCQGTWRPLADLFQVFFTFPSLQWENHPQKIWRNHQSTGHFALVTGGMGILWWIVDEVAAPSEKNGSNTRVWRVLQSGFP